MAAIVSAKAERPAVGEVVAGDGGHDGVRRPIRATASATRSGSSGSSGKRVARVDEAEAARPRAALAVDHERRRAVGPALEDVRAARLLADRDEGELAHRRAEPDHLGADPEPAPRTHSGLRLESATPVGGIDPGVDEAAIERPVGSRDTARPAPLTGRRRPGRATRPPRRVLALDRPPRRELLRAPGARSPRRPRASSPHALGRDRGDAEIGEPARHDVAEHGQVRVDVQGEAVHRPAPADPHPDGADLPRRGPSGSTQTPG